MARKVKTCESDDAGQADSPSRSGAERQCAKWNAKHPAGADVVLTTDAGQKIETKTRSAASVLGGHSAVVWLDGFAGCWSLSSVKARPQ